MKTLKLLANFIFPTILFLLALLLGFVAAAISAGIEYDVLSGIIRTSIGGTSVALLIVFCLEGYKVFLHLYIAIAKNREKGSLARRGMQVMACALVSFSLLCTFVWTAHVMYVDVVEADDASYQADVDQINSEHDAQKAMLKQEAEAKKTSLTKPYEDRYYAALESYNTYEVSLRGKTSNGFSTEEKERLRIVSDEAFTEWQSQKAKIDAEVSAELTSALNEVENSRTKALQDRTEVVSTNTGTNEYIHVVLTAISHYLMGSDTYSPLTYFLVSMLVSVLLAAILEAIICCSMYLMSLPVPKWEDILQTSYLTDKQHRAVRLVVNSVLAAFCSTVLFLVYCMFRDFGVSTDTLVGSLAIFIFVNISVGLCYRIAEPKQKVEQHDKKEISHRLIYLKDELTETAIKGCLSFIGYILLGLIFGNNFQELTLSAVGMSIGSVGGQLIRLPEKNAA